MSDAQKLEDLQKRLQKEKSIKDATLKLREVQESDSGKAACDATLADVAQRIFYFQNEIDKLILKQQMNTSGPVRTQIPITLPNPEGAPESVRAARAPRSPHTQPQTTVDEDGTVMEFHGDFLSNRPLSTVDLLKSETAITTKKVEYKLRELAYKLDVEKKVKVASEKLEQLGMTAKDGNAESAEKVALLKRALQKYQGLYIPGQEEEVPTVSGSGTALRRPMTGVLHVRLSGIKHQNNVPTRNSKPAESMAIIKIDGVVKGKTRMARNGPQGIRWNEEFEIPVTKASEIEITICDKPDYVPVTIGMFWLKISDLVEELRRKKVEADNDAAWAAANVHELAVKNHLARPSTGSVAEVAVNSTVDGVESWWDLEPIGQISMKFNFVKDVAIRKRPSRLGRQGAVRKRKDEIREIQGHKFVSQKFYEIMCCALCAELFTGKGSQCEDCNFSCHQRCAEKVFIKCISSNSAEDPDEAKLNHRIPHRFETFTNLSPTWCSHCGHMLTFGRRHKKCSECPVMAHDGCSDLVPNHCGMPAETANKLMEEIRRRNQSGRFYAAGANKHAKKPSETKFDTIKPPHQSAFSEKDPAMIIAEEQEALKQQQLQLQMEQLKLQQERESREKEIMLQKQKEHQLQLQQQQEQLQQQQLQQQQKQQQLEQQRAQLQQQQVYQQQMQQQRQDSERAHELDKFRREQARLEQLRLEQERAQQKIQGSPMTTPQMEQKPLVMPKVHTPTLKIVNKLGRKFAMNDFHFLAVLGRGNFGKVMLAEDKKGGELFAIKALKKESIVKHDEVESARSEKRIFQVANKDRHPFLTTLHSCFQTDTRIYFVMEYVRGGDLMMHIQMDKRFGERRAKFYGCEVLLALQYFHENNIVYRDLKLDNIMLALDGHIKIGDYGLCKENMPYGVTTRTICGTPEFMAPEIIEEQPYDRSVDWWTFGVLMYEMLLGRAPFSGEEEDDIYDSIMDDEPFYPAGFGRHEQALLQSLLVKVPALRLGAGPTDAEEIKAHAYFRNVNFDDVFHKRIPPPFLPKISSAKDVSNFDSEFTSESTGETPTDYRLNNVEQDLFKGFSYVSPWIPT
ncbi:Serine/threonine kinase [Mortierella antarctica]|nr:Serine/threonine kinase [Mortierella antarctica]KAG0353680.1 Serine/threonine kinase [Podila minutissima]